MASRLSRIGANSSAVNGRPTPFELTAGKEWSSTSDEVGVQRAGDLEVVAVQGVVQRDLAAVQQFEQLVLRAVEAGLAQGGAARVGRLPLRARPAVQDVLVAVLQHVADAVAAVQV